MSEDYEERQEKPGLGLSIAVSHPASDTSGEYTTREHDLLAESDGDADGHAINAVMMQSCGEALALVTLQHGMSAAAAAGILRKLADRIEGVGNSLLSMKIGACVYWDNDGSFKVLTSGNDDSGDGGVHLPDWALEALGVIKANDELDALDGDGGE